MVEAEFYDAAVSGADPVTERPGFLAMLQRIAGNGIRTTRSDAGILRHHHRLSTTCLIPTAARPARVRSTAPPDPNFAANLWLLTHSDLRQSPRVRVFLDFVAMEIAKQRQLIEGTARTIGGDVLETLGSGSGSAGSGQVSQIALHQRR